MSNWKQCQLKATKSRMAWPKSEPMKRKRMALSVVAARFFLIAKIDRTWSIISHNQIKVNPDYPKFGTVLFQNQEKLFGILYRGSYEDCVKRSSTSFFPAQLFIDPIFFTIDISDDECHGRKRARNNSAHLTGQNSESYEEGEVIQLSSDDEEQEEEEEEVGEEEETLSTLMAESTITESTITCEETPITCKKRLVYNTLETQEEIGINIKTLEAMQDQINMLLLNEKKQVTYVHGNRDLIKDVDGRNCVFWALHVAKVLFTQEELIANCIEPGYRSSRGHLDPVRVAKLKGAFKAKYEYTGEKYDKSWAEIKRAINRKGNTLRIQATLQRLLNRN